VQEVEPLYVLSDALNSQRVVNCAVIKLLEIAVLGLEKLNRVRLLRQTIAVDVSRPVTRLVGL